jgi:hypothetical protein
MKVISKYIFIFLVLLSLSGCSDSQMNTIVKKYSALKSYIHEKIFGVETFNLLNPNLEIPNACKPPLASENNKLAFVRFRGRVNRCIHVIDQNPTLNNFEEVKSCINEIGERFREIPIQSCKNLVLVPGATGNAPSVMELMLNRFYTTHVVVIENGNTIFKWDQLTNYFSLVSRWYHQTRNSMYPLGTEKVISVAQASDFENKINKRVWNDLQSYSVEWRETFGEIVKPIPTINPDGSTRTPEELQALRIEKNTNFKIFETMLTVNKKLLDSLFASELATNTTLWTETMTTAAPSPLLAAMLGDALSPFFQRVRVVAKIYDIACKLKGCDHNFYQSNMTYWFLKYFHSLATNQNLEILPFDENETGKPLPVFLTTINQNKIIIKNLSEALASSFNVPNVATSVSGNDFPHFLASYKKVFEESYDLITNYENSRRTLNDGTQLAGYFVSQGVQEVNVGFSKLNMDRHIQNVRDTNERLSILRDSFSAQKHTLIQEVLNINSSAIKLKDLKTNINIDVTEMMNKKNEMDAIRNFIYEGRLQFADQIQSIINDPNYSGNDKNFIANATETFSVDAINTSQGNFPDKIDGTFLKVLDTSHQFKKGDILQIGTNGEWSPTCAASEKYGNQMRFSRTGGRGFSLIESNGKSIVQSTNNYKTKESFSSISASVEVCAGYGFSAVFSSSARACLSASAGQRWANGTNTSDTTSDSQRSDASFDIGLGLPNTPFDYLAAGSLLFVEMPRGDNIKSHARKIVALSQSNSIVLDNDNSDYYLIGNDCQSSNNSGQLTVTMTHLEPQGLKATQFVSKIESVLGEVENRVQGLISQGQLNFQVLETLKLQLKALGGDTNNFNGQMHNLLESLISYETSVLGFKSQLIVMERDMEIRKKKLIGLLDQYTAEDEAHYLRVGTRNWLLSNMDLDFVNGPSENQNLYTLNRILSTMENSLVSYVDFKYRNDEKRAILGDVSLLQNIQFSDSFDVISKKITTYTRILLDNLAEDLNNKPVIPKTTVGIRIPNPFYQPTFPIPPSNSLHPVLDPTRARDFWLTLNNWEVNGVKQDLKLNILVDDLYAKNGLGCYVQAPIIESWGMFFIPENEGYITDFNNNYRHKNIKLHLEGASIIPYENEPRSYNFVGSNWRFMDSAVRMAKNANDGLRQLVTEFPPEAERETGLGTGRPMFGRFKIGDLRPWRSESGQVYIGETPINEIKEVFLGYVVSASSADFYVNMNWIKHCAQ